MKKNSLLFIFSFLIIIASCKKHLGDKPVVPIAPEVPSKDSWIAGINKEIASILEQVYQNDSAYMEVNATILSGYYVDERVLLKDLLFPERSDVYNSVGFRKFNIQGGVFKRIFNEVLNNGDYPLLKEALAKEVETDVEPKTSVIASNSTLASQSTSLFSGTLAPAIYFPYSLVFGTNGSSVIPNLQAIPHATIVAAESEADSGQGKEPYSCTPGRAGLCYRDVLVDDGYAEAFPTHIVENGARPKIAGIASVATGDRITRVYLGWAKLTRQMDALISFTGNGGGSEIKVARISGYLKKEGEQITDFSGDVVTLDYSRSDIKHQNWKRVYSIWDPDWIKENPEQVYAVYEDDTKGTKTLAGSLSATASLSAKPVDGKTVGELSYKVEVSTQDEIITQRKIDRNSFMKDGMNNQGWNYISDADDFLPLYKDWPIYDGGTIWQYSMAWKTN